MEVKGKRIFERSERSESNAGNGNWSKSTESNVGNTSGVESSYSYYSSFREYQSYTLPDGRLIRKERWSINDNGKKTNHEKMYEIAPENAAENTRKMKSLH